MQETQMLEKHSPIIAEVEKENNIVVKIDMLLHAVTEMFFANKMDGSEDLMAYAEDLAKKQDYRRGYALVRVKMASYYYFKSEITLALNAFNEGVNILEEIGDFQSIAESLPLLSMSFWSIGEYAKAFENSTKAVKLFEELPNKTHYPLALNSLATQYFDLKDVDKAAYYFDLALQNNSAQTIDTKRFRARTLIGLANIALLKKDLDTAETHLTKALEIQTEVRDFFGKGRTLNDLAKLNKERGNLNSALIYYEKTIELRKTFLDKHPLITSYLDLGELYFENNSIEQALAYYFLGLELSEKMNAKAKVWRAHLLISQTYKTEKRFEEALIHYEKFVEIKESVLGDEATLKVKNLQTKFESEKSEKEAEIYRLKNVELKCASDLISEQNKNIIDSINYAKRIQLAILPPEQNLRAWLKDFYVFYQPRDIVSGDFYWFANKNAYDDDIFGNPDTESGTVIAIADCTGHGVPGALMSMMGVNFLEEIVLRRHITSPSLILQELHKSIKFTLKQDDNSNRDGMDIAIVRINKEKTRLDFAGAMNGMLITYETPNGTAFEHIEPDKKGVGGLQKGNEILFTRRTIDLKKYQNPTFYLYTDGFADQFGGETKRKFMRKNFFELLKNLSHLDFNLQKNLLSQTITDWIRIANEKQIDDMLVMGFKI